MWDAALIKGKLEDNMTRTKEFLKHRLSRIHLQVQSPNRRYKPFSRYIKVRMQMLIGLVLFALILVKIIHYSIPSIPFPITFSTSIVHIINLQVLEIVAGALYLSTAIDLAYMLFTPALDEAVEPLISGLAATILLTLSKTQELKDINNEIS